MMPKRLLLIPLVVLVLGLACSLPRGPQTQLPDQPTLRPSQNGSDYFPLKKGAYWVYRGTVKWTKLNSSDVVEEEITWKMEVRQVLSQNDVVGYEMLGAPWDLAWYEPEKKPSQYGIVQVSDMFFRLPAETLERLPNAGDSFPQLMNEGKVFLDTSLETGERFCASEYLARSDTMYCWTVGERKQFDLGNVKGVDPAQGLWEYPVVNQTTSDISTIYFVPGLGISGYSYRHHGTVSEVDVYLIEYYHGE